MTNTDAQRMSDHDRVYEFHHRFGLHIAERPTPLPTELALFRLARLQEELYEFAKAVAATDLPAAADALIDLNYISHGTAVSMGVPWEPLFAAVHHANMSKRRVAASGESRFGSAYDIVKPEGWRPPNVADILRAHGWESK